VSQIVESTLTDKPIVSRAANALLDNVSLSQAARAYSTYGTWGILNAIVGAFKKRQGGLWVGGNISLYRDRISFRPNALNTALQEGDLGVDIPLRNVKGAVIRRAFLVDIVDVTWANDHVSIFSFRCYKMREFLSQIEQEFSNVT
jgi:hypothetical protein